MSTTGRPDSWAITSPRSDRVKRIAALSGRSARRKQGRFRVEGPQAVRSLLQRRPELVRELFLTEEGAVGHPELADLAADAGIAARIVEPEILRAMTRSDDGSGARSGSGSGSGSGSASGSGSGPGSGSDLGSTGTMANPQGAVAVADLASAPLDETLRSLPGAATTVLVLHEVQDPGNAGTLIRAADASGASAVLATSGTVDVHAPKVVRSAAGSLFHLPVVTGIAPGALLPALRTAGLSVLATSGYADNDLYSTELPPRSAWIMGNEAHGLPAEVLEQADLAVRIPLAGAAESLNVAIAATVCLFETLRRR